MNGDQPVVPSAGVAADDNPAAPGRRNVLKALALGVPGALAMSGAQTVAQAAQPAQAADAAQPAPLRFFNAQEAALMDAIAARLIPADDLGPGAKEAGVTVFLDGQLAGAWGAGDHLYRQGPFQEGTPEQGYQLSFTPAEMYRRGLAAFDAAVRKKEGKGYDELGAERQDAWLAAVRGLDGFQGRSSLKTWLLTITANTAKSRLRQVRREVFLDDLPGPHGTVDDQRFAADGHWSQPPHAWHEDSPEALLAEGELRDCLDKTLNGLSELQRSVLTLRERQGLELEEIRDLLDITLSNVRVLLHRARLKVFATLEHFEETGQC